MISHVTLGSHDVERAGAFYDKVLACLGYTRSFAGDGFIGYGSNADGVPKFWVCLPFDGQPAGVGNGTHVAFTAESRDQVDDFHRVALAEGGSDEGAPGPRPHYGEHYYGAYVRDPDGNKIQAVCRRPPVEP